MATIEPKIFDELKTALSSFGDKYFIGNELNRSKLTDDLRAYDEALLSRFFEINFIKQHYITEVAGQKLFQIEQLQDAILYNDYWDTSYTKYENRVGLASNGKFLQDSQDVVLDFPFKDGVLTASMTKEDAEDGYDDAFLNEVIEKDEIDRLFDKKILTNVKRYGQASLEQIDDKIVSFNKDKDNLIIKGNNLLVLHTIAEKYTQDGLGLAKLIYIDPPYNTGKDSFSYNDKFNRSSWLTFMKNRLEIASKLLREDGSIFISIDEKQYAYLRILCDEIFGENNLLETFHFQVRYTSKSLNERDNFQPVMEYCLAYAKNKSVFKPNKPSIPYDTTKFNLDIKELKKADKIIEVAGRKVEVFLPESYSIEKVSVEQTENLSYFKETWVTGSIYSGTGHGQMYQKVVEPRLDEDGHGVLYKIDGLGEDGLGYRYMTGPKKVGATKGKMYNKIPTVKLEGIRAGTYAKEVPIVNYYDFSSQVGNIRHEGGVAFNSGKKPEKMLKMIFDIATDKNDLILDYHLGSGSSAAVALKMNRRFIGIEQMDYIEDLAVKRLNTVIDGDQTGISPEVNWQGGSSFVYAELFPKNMGYLQDIIHSSDLTELKTVYDRMLSGIDGSQEPADLSFRADLDKIEWEASKVKFDDQKRLLVKLLDKNGLYYNYSEIDDTIVSEFLSEEDIAFNKAFYESEA